MARPNNKVADDTGEGIPALEVLKALMQQHEQLCHRLATVVQQVAAEMEAQKIQAHRFAHARFST